MKKEQRKKERETFQIQFSTRWNLHRVSNKIGKNSSKLQFDNVIVFKTIIVRCTVKIIGY